MPQRPFIQRLAIGFALTTGLAAPLVVQAADWAVDTSHTSVVFRIRHAGLSNVYGQFRQFGGKFSYDAAAPEKSTFEFNVQVASIDTNQEKRDEHLRSPDFFSAKEFPTIAFKSTSVKAKGKTLEVTGDLTLHGTTKSVTIPFEVEKGEFPKGTPRVGATAEFSIKRSDFGMKGMVGAIGDDVQLYLSLEGVAPK